MASQIEEQLMGEIKSHLGLLSGRGFEESVYGILRSASEQLSDLLDEVHDYEDERDRMDEEDEWN